MARCPLVLFFELLRTQKRFSCCLLAAKQASLHIFLCNTCAGTHTNSLCREATPLAVIQMVN